uniref:Monooxygenase n=1 Tax=uncultured bacterium fosmid I5J7 TaxID=1701911 RepID=A0A1B0THA2_9BACT|nr:monooxygenase [uncultured bacterium fosmid I5J7]
MKVVIVGGGIGGLAAALMLHDRGIKADVYERSEEIRELGVGINTLPHAIRELANIGLLDALDSVAIRTHELIYQNRQGQTIWQELRGTDAGLDMPQFSIHRGRLQGVLRDAVIERLGADAIRTGHACTGVRPGNNSATAIFQTASAEELPVEGDAVIACDGIHSVVRKQFYPDQGDPKWNGIMLWRGACLWDPFLTGRSMVIAGGMDAKLVLYPIANDARPDAKVLMNWAVAAKMGDGSTPMPRREDWNREGVMSELLPFVENTFSLDVVDPLALIRETGTFYEYPMCDRDPVAQWTFDRVTLLGDAAHPMYPVGSNGASQAILDARCLADRLADCDNDVSAALLAYQTERLPATSEIVRQNRDGGPERVIDLVNQRAPDGFERLEDVAGPDELEAVVRGYQKTAGFDKASVNR